MWRRWLPPPQPHMGATRDGRGREWHGAIGRGAWQLLRFPTTAADSSLALSSSRFSELGSARPLSGWWSVVCWWIRSFGQAVPQGWNPVAMWSRTRESPINDDRAKLKEEKKEVSLLFRFAPWASRRVRRLLGRYEFGYEERPAPVRRAAVIRSPPSNGTAGSYGQMG